MSLTIAIIVIAAADVALLALVAFVMSRAAKLTPHVSTVVVAEQPMLDPAGARAQRQHRAGTTPRRRATATAASAQA